MITVSETKGPIPTQVHVIDSFSCSALNSAFLSLKGLPEVEIRHNIMTSPDFRQGHVPVKSGKEHLGRIIYRVHHNISVGFCVIFWTV